MTENPGLVGGATTPSQAQKRVTYGTEGRKFESCRARQSLAASRFLLQEFHWDLWSDDIWQNCEELRADEGC